MNDAENLARLLGHVEPAVFRHLMVTKFDLALPAVDAKKSKTENRSLLATALTDLTVSQRQKLDEEAERIVLLSDGPGQDVIDGMRQDIGFGCIEDARTHCQAFFAWYNDQHCHSGIGYMTPHSVHYGLAAGMRVIRQATLDAAFVANPNRFKHQRPRLPPMPTAAWINPPPEEKKPISEPFARTLN